MNIKLAERTIEQWVEKNAKLVGLKGSVTVNYIWNPGGVVNQSFRITDGTRVRHVKFGPVHKVERLKKWAKIGKELHKSYHAPRLVTEIPYEVLPGYPFGLVFEYIDGKILSSSSSSVPFVLEIMELLNHLHKDLGLAKSLKVTPFQTYAEAFHEEYIRRFEENLSIIQEDRKLLDFVSDDSLRFFSLEVERLKNVVNQSKAFQHLASDVVHNDLNHHNIIVNHEKQQFWIIDWDDLSVSGDAAMDYSLLLWPYHKTMEWPPIEEKLLQLISDKTLERMDLYFQAKLLDDVIDVLADFIEVEDIPSIKEKTQVQAKKIHLESYKEYMDSYGKE